MFMLWLYRYITGYVKFCARGGFSERFLNLCAHRGITVWGSYRHKDVLYGYVLAREYKKLRSIVKKSRVKLRVQERHGLVFIINRYRRRKGILVGLLMFFGILWFLSQFIWNINVVGNVNVKQDAIIMALKEVGVSEGKMRKSINAQNARQQLLIRMPDLSWAAINMKGTLATIDVRETTEPPDSTTNNLPCNIKAAADGRIISIKMYEGTAVAKVGEAVVKGDLLISGAVELKNGMTIFKHARADVIAETMRELSVFVPFEQSNMVRTGESQTRRVVTLFSINIPTFLGSVDKPYQTERTTWRPEIDGVKLPISIVTAKFYKIGEQIFTINEDTAKATAEEKMRNLSKKELGDSITGQIERRFKREENGVRLTVKFLCKENIAVDENILIN